MPTYHKLRVKQLRGRKIDFLFSETLGRASVLLKKRRVEVILLGVKYDRHELGSRGNGGEGADKKRSGKVCDSSLEQRAPKRNNVVVVVEEERCE